MPPMAVRGAAGPTRRVLYVSVAFVLCAWAAGVLLSNPAPQPQSRFAEQIAALSEPGGHFDTDNLISNEASYLQVLPHLSQGRAPGGAYIGVGPDQNYSYIAAVRPARAYIIDIRRDNMLLHLLFKSIFALAETRADYLALLTARPISTDAKVRRGGSIEEIVRRIDESRPDDRSTAVIRSRVDAAIARMGVPLSDGDWQTIDRFHRRFISAALDLRFQSAGRPPRSYYPTYRQLLFAQDGSGALRHFLASGQSFEFVKQLHATDRIVPIVGDVSGNRALAAVADALGRSGERVSVFYISNVEFYLFRGNSYEQFIENLRRLPRTTNAVLIRSLFNQYAFAGGGAGEGSVSRLAPISELLDRSDQRKIRRYTDLIERQ